MGQRLDRQEYVLPKEAARQTLESVTITDSGNIGLSRAVLAGLTVSACQGDVAVRISVSADRIIYHTGSKLYTQKVLLANTDKTSALDGPLFLVLEDLSAGVSLVNSSDATSCFATVGSPFIVVLPKGSALAPNTTAVIRLSLSSHGATP